jgi:hypothetical protein
MSDRAVAHVKKYSRPLDDDLRRLLEVLAKYADDDGRGGFVDEETGEVTRYLLTPGGVSLKRRDDA